MRRFRFSALVFVLLPFLFPPAVSAQLPIPALIGGTLTVDGVRITAATGDAFAISAIRPDGTPFDPPARDDDGLNEFDFYVINIPIHDESEQPGGARPGETAAISVVREGRSLTILQPSGGRIVVGEAGSSTVVDIVAETGNGNGGTENRPPVADAGPDRTVSPGDSVTLDPSASSDPDPGDVLSFQWLQTAGFAVNPADAGGGRRTFVAPNVSPGQEIVLEFRLVATDSGGLSDSDEVVVTVRGGQNRPPVANAGPDRNVSPGDRVLLDGGNSTDPDSPGNGIADYVWRQVLGTSVSLILTGDPSRVEFVAPASSDGGEALVFELTVADAGGLTGSDRVTINVVSPGNRPPVADAGTDRAVVAGEVVTLDGRNSSDPDPGDFIAGYSWRQLSGPAVILADADTVRARFTAPSAGGAALTFELRVTDSRGLQATDQVTINLLSDGNRPPVADAGPDQQVREGDAVVLDGSNSSDPDGNIGLFLWSQVSGPAVVLDDAKAMRPRFAAPAVGAAGAVLVFELTVVDDGLLQAADRTRVEVLSIARPPVADAGVNRIVAPGELVVLDGGDSRDEDGFIVAYRWRQIAGPAVVLSGPDRAIVSFVAPDSGETTLRFELTVTDDDGLTGVDETMVRVTAGSLPPLADAGPDVFVTGGFITALNATRSRGRDAEIVAYLWRQIAGPGVTFSDPADPRPTFLVPRVSEPGVALVFELVVTDAEGLRDSDEVVYTIESPGEGPGDDGDGCFLRVLGSDAGRGFFGWLR